MTLSIRNLLHKKISLKAVLTSFFALGLLSANVFSADIVTPRPHSDSSIIVKGIEYQPNIVQQDQLHIKVKKKLINGKPATTISNPSESLVGAPEASTSRESVSAYEDPDFWIYDSFVVLTTDIDYDGYYSSFKLEFDVDTVYASASIYAVIYTSTSDEFVPFYTTDIYNINGDNTSDAIIIENDLVTGFPSNDYELMIIIYDADSNQAVAVSDGNDDADLAFLSLESEDFEYVKEIDIVYVEHAGSMGILFIIGIAFAAYRRALS